MATIIAVHGTFAHWDGRPSESAAPGAEPQWWQRGSAAEADFDCLVEGLEGPVRQVRFLWNGDNSELERRRAGSALLGKLLELEAAGEAYCLVGHSHGGSVISAALMEAAARKKDLPGLKRWVTVGTPFVTLRKETTLFLRLTLLQKAVFVASLMLLLMFGFYIVSDILSGGADYTNEQWLRRTGIYFAMMSLPFALFWLVFKIIDHRKLYFYRPKNRKRAAETFAPRWIGLWHKDDEALSGLSSVGGFNVRIFHRDFAVPAISLFSVFLLPVIYLFMVTSPGAMTGIANYLRDSVYQIDVYDDYEAEVIAARQNVRQIRRSLRETRGALERAEADGEVGVRLDAEKRLKSLRIMLREAREKMHAENPNLVAVERALRFKRRFLSEGGKPCDGNTLCGGGRNIALNSQFLLHIVTDEAASMFLDEELWQGRLGRLARILLPVLLVPVVFGIVAVLLVFAVQWIGRVLSGLLSHFFDELTWWEIRRSALGNDTETEVALTARPRPPWIAEGYPALPAELSSRLTDFSNEAAAQSLWKFRNAIGEFAFSEGDKEKNLLDFLTWRELIHSSYFEVPEFRWLLAEVIAQNDGFKRGPEFENTDAANTASRWYAQVGAERAAAPQSATGTG